MDTPFWQTKTLEEMSTQEWESLCDGCGKCCLLRMEDADKAEIIYVTNIRCKLLDGASCQCKNYEKRQHFVPDCVKLTPEKVKKLAWIPHTCAYRLIAEGKKLPSWHHLVCGDKNAVHEAGQSVKNATVCEQDVDEDEHYRHITIWPGEPDVLA